jgi:hypothetical protein
MEQPTFLLLGELFDNYCKQTNTPSLKEVEKIERFTKAFVFCWNKTPTCPQIDPEVDKLRGCEYVAKIIQILQNQDLEFFRKLNQKTLSKNIETLEKYGVKRGDLLKLEQSVWDQQQFFTDIQSIFETITRNNRYKPRHFTLLAMLGMILFKDEARAGRNIKVVNVLPVNKILFSTETGFQSVDLISGLIQSFDQKCTQISQSNICDSINQRSEDLISLRRGEFAFRCKMSGKIVKLKPYIPSEIENHMEDMKIDIYQNTDILKFGEIIFPSPSGAAVVNFQMNRVRVYENRGGLLKENSLDTMGDDSDPSFLNFGSIIFNQKGKNSQTSLVGKVSDVSKKSMEESKGQMSFIYNMGAL